jgi:NADPH-dependent 2,4-dienoyl-CoA reductase/sulfur reductase-like enzyme
MVKSGLPIKGKKIVVAGSGPLLLAVAVYLREHGAQIALICEQASKGALAKFALSLIGQPEKIRQAMAFRRNLQGVPLSTSSWPVAAEGKERIESVTILKAGREQKIACDYLACGFHLVPNTELASLLGCQLKNGYVAVDEFQQTSLSKIFCAGEPTGIGGLELALLDGQIAGLAAAAKNQQAARLFAERKNLRGFARALERAFRLRAELKKLAADETIVCRCEDVRYGRLRNQKSWQAAKLQTRCGMGPCQGRICGSALEFIFGWVPDSPRPPVFPARVQTLAARVVEPLAHNSVSESGGPA